MLTGFQCPQDTMAQFKPGSKHDVEDCLYVCETPCIARELIHTAWEQEFHNPHRGAYISVTSLGGCARELYLERKFGYYIEPRRAWYRVRGVIIHKITESEGLRDWVSEFSVSCKMGDFSLGGTVDGYQPSRRELSDKKTLKDSGIKYVLDGAKEKDVFQVNAYKWIIEHNPALVNQVPVESLKITYLTMSDVVETGRPFTTRERLYYTKTGQAQLKKGATIDPHDKNKQLVTLHIPPVPILDSDEVGEMIRTRFERIRGYLHGDMLPPLLKETDPDMARWKCCSYYCDVFDLCQEGIDNPGKYRCK